MAALRLEYLAAAFAPSSRRFLQETKPGRVELALDLGSAFPVDFRRAADGVRYILAVGS